MLFEWLERRIDPFAPFDDTETPPATVARFAWHYLAPVRLWLAVLFVSALAFAAVESSLFLLLGWFVDLFARSSPDRLVADHGPALAAAAALILVVRPVVLVLNEAISNQIVVPQTTNLIRWRTHAFTLGHSLGYFQGDFAGRLANRITQAGPAIARARRDRARHAALRRGVRGDGARDVRIDQPVARAADGGLDRGLCRAAALLRAAGADRSLASAEARSVTVGRIVDSYTNILTVKLFARSEARLGCARRADPLDARLPGSCG